MMLGRRSLCLTSLTIGGPRDTSFELLSVSKRQVGRTGVSAALCSKSTSCHLPRSLISAVMVRSATLVRLFPPLSQSCRRIV